MIPLNDKLYELKRSAIRQYTNLAKQTAGCILFTLGEPDFDTPQPVKDAAIQAIQAGQTHYSMNQGSPALREAVAEYETDRGMCCTSEEVLITAGATGALFTAMLGVLDPGDEVVVPTPAFPLYETITTLAGAKLVPLDITKTDFQITREALDQAITPKTKAIVLNTPNNPTGTVLNKSSLAAVKAAVLGKAIYVIFDGVYQQLSALPCPDLSLDEELRHQVILCQSFSKPYAMTGWRVGYLVAPVDVMEKLLLLNAAQVASIPTFLQTACITALKTDVSQMAAVYHRRGEYVSGRLRDMGLDFPTPGGAFYAFPYIQKFGIDSGTFCTRMIREAKVAAVPGGCFGADGYIRLSYACSDEELKEGLDRMEAFIHTL